MKEKIKSLEKIKNEAVLFLVMLIVFLFRFPFRKDVLHILYGESLVTNVGMKFGIVNYLDSFDRYLYILCVIAVVLMFCVYFIFSLNFIRGQDNKERAMYICTIFSVIPMSVFSVISRDNFSIIALTGVLTAGVCLLFCEKEKNVILIPIFLLLSAVVSPICMCIAFSIIFYSLKYEFKNNKKQTLHTTAYILSFIEYAVCTAMVIFTYIGTPYFIKDYFIPCVVTILLSIPVMMPLFIIFKGYDKKFIFTVILMSIPILLASTDTRFFTMCIVNALIFSAIYLLKKENISFKKETDKLFTWIENHIFLSCCYLIYCCVLSASSLGVAGKITEKLLRYFVL